MKITVTLSIDEMEEIKSVKSNHIRNSVDFEINLIDAIDSVLDLPGYDVEIEVAQ